MIDWIGYIAAIITTGSFIPQTVKTIKTRDTSGISFYMYFFFLIGIALWFVYGIMLDAWPIILANGLTMISSSIILFYKIRNMKRGEE